MRRNLILTAAAAALAIGLTIPMLANGATAITAHLTGDQIVNENGGDPDGSANITLRVNRVEQRVCWTVTYKKLDDVTGSFIHKGAADEVGRDTVTLFERSEASGTQGCTHELRKRIVKRLKRKPDAHYVDITTKEYPDGAVRGQLEK